MMQTVRLRFILFAILLLHRGAAALAGGPHPSLPSPVVPDCLGVDIHFVTPKPGEIEMLAAAGFKWVRADFNWTRMETAPGRYDFSAYDRLVAKLDQHKLRAVFILAYGNPLYADPGDTFPFTSRAGTPEFRAAFARWAAAAARHFAGRGYLWEMWNEPNANHWKPQANAADYAALAKATGQALREAAPGEAFIGPGLAGTKLRFLETCFQAGLLEYWDAVSVHPYRETDPELVAPEYAAIEQLIAKYAPPGKTIPIIASEWGYCSAWAGFDEQRQAKMFAREITTNLAHRVPLTIWYDWRDDGPIPKPANDHFGLVKAEYHPGRTLPFDPKPAYFAVKEFVEKMRASAPAATKP